MANNVITYELQVTDKVSPVLQRIAETTIASTKNLRDNLKEVDRLAEKAGYSDATAQRIKDSIKYNESIKERIRIEREWNAINRRNSLEGAVNESLALTKLRNDYAATRLAYIQKEVEANRMGYAPLTQLAAAEKVINDTLVTRRAIYESLHTQQERMNAAYTTRLSAVQRENALLTEQQALLARQATFNQANFAGWGSGSAADNRPVVRNNVNTNAGLGSFPSPRTANSQVSLVAGMANSVSPSFASMARGNIVSGMTAAGNAASAAATARNTEELRRNAEAARAAERAHQALLTRITEYVIGYNVVNAVLNTFANAIKSIPRVGIELDTVKASLSSTIDTTAMMGSALAALDKEAERSGIVVSALRENFRNFQASTSLAGVSLDSTWKMFTGLNTVITALHLSTDKANGVFIAMAQIFNKSKVQSEELVKQLGNLLPGAFASFATAIGKSPALLAKEMKKGMIFAQDTMELFIEYMENKFAVAFMTATENLNANINRMSTSFTHLGEKVYEISSGPMNAFVKGVTSITDSITMFLSNSENVTTVLASIKTALEVLGVLAGITMLKYLFAFTTSLDAAGKAVNISGKAVAAFTVALNVLKGNPITAVIVGLGTLATYMYNVGDAAKASQRSITEMYRQMKQEQTAYTNDEKIKLAVENDDTVKKVMAANRVNSNDLDAMLNSPLVPKNPASRSVAVTTEIDTLVRKIEQGAELLNSARSQALVKAEMEVNKVSGDVLTRGIEAADRARIASLTHSKDLTEQVTLATLRYKDTHKDVYSYIASAEKGIIKDKYNPEVTELEKQEAVNAATVKVNIEKGLADELQQVRDSFNKKSDSSDKKALTAHTKLVRDSYKEESNDLRNAYEDNLIATETYYNKLRELAGASITERAKIERDYAKTQRDLLVQMQQAKADVLTATGDPVGASKIQAGIQYDALIKRAELDASAAKPEQATAYQEQIANLKLLRDLAPKNTALTEADTQATRKHTEALNAYNQAMNEINIKTNLGVMSPLEGAFASDKLRPQRESDLQADITRLQGLQEQAKGTKNVNAAYQYGQDLIAAQNELKNFQLQGSNTVNFMANQFAPILGNAFTDFANGTKTATEAMRDMTKNFLLAVQQMIVQTLALIAVQKVAGLITGSFSAGGNVQPTPSNLGGGTNSWGSAIFANAQPRAEGGEILQFPNGGRVRGPGTETSDSIKAIVPIGSYVLNAKAAKAFVKLSNNELVIPPSEVQKKGVAHWDKVNKMNFADGGFVGNNSNILPFPTTQKDSSSNTSKVSSVNNINVTVQHTGKESPDELGQKISLEIVKAIAQAEAKKQVNLNSKQMQTMSRRGT